jgi:hypothetical protein
LQFYTRHKPLKCEIDAYGDFLQALGPEASTDYCSNTANVTFVTEDLVKMREEVYNALKGTPLNVAIFNQVCALEGAQCLHSLDTLHEATYVLETIVEFKTHMGLVHE